MNSQTPHQRFDQHTIDDTLRYMRQFAQAAQTDKINLDIRGLSERICREVTSGDYASEVLAIYYWVCNPANIRYQRDPVGVELLKEPHRTVKDGCGDCDDMATLIAAMLMSIGHRCRFVVAGFDGSPAPSHVFCQAVSDKGDVVTLDPVANRETKTMHRRVSALQIYPA